MTDILEGKVVSIRIEGSDFSHDLVDPAFVEKSGRTFVVGRVPSGASVTGWSDGAVSGIAWDKVLSYVLFDSLEEYFEAVKKSDDYEEAPESRSKPH